MNDKSILLRLEEQGQAAPRVQLPGSDEVARTSSAERYEFVGEIARGGVGVVWKGRDADLGRDVAIKVLRDDHVQSPEMVQRFVEEAQIGGQLQHPGIVPVYEMGVRGKNQPYFAMKLVKGRTFTDLLSVRKDPTENRRALLAHFAQACQTVAYAHARGVIHRDLKPSNIMVGNFGEVQVVDWGFAKVLKRGGVADEKRARHGVTVVATVRSAVEGSASIAGSIMGTPAYMPPEQALGHVEDLTERADVFALGAILCEILTGAPPYAGSKEYLLTAAAHARLDDAYKRIDTSGADAELRSLARACLSALPKDRPKSAREVADTLSVHLAAAESRAHKARLEAAEADLRVEEQRRAKRQTLVISAAILALVIVGGGAFFAAAGSSAARERERTAAYDAALLDATRLAASGHDWPGARAASDRAAGLAGDDAARRAEATALGTRIEKDAAAADRAARKARAEEELLAKLEEIRLGYIDTQDSMRFAAEYAAALPDVAAFGDFDRKMELAAHLDSHARVIRTSKRLQGHDWRPLHGLACELDPDPWRKRLREAVVSDDLATIRKLASEADPASMDARSLVTLGLAIDLAGDRAGALALLRRAFERFPGDLWINLYLTIVAGHPNAHQAVALTHARVAVALRPASARVHALLIGNLLVKGEIEAGLAECREAVRRDPEYLYAHAFLGCALELRGDLDGGIKEMREVLRLDPDCANAHSAIGGVLMQKRDLDGAIAAFREALRLNPDMAGAHGRLAKALQDKGDRANAIAACREAMQLEPQNREWHFRLGALLLGDRDLDGAIPAFREALRLDPACKSAHYNLCLALLERGDLPGAEAEAREELRLYPEGADAHHALGVLLGKRGDPSGAVVACREAVRLDPEASNRRKTHLDLLLKAFKALLHRVLDGAAPPADAIECLGLAELCHYDGSHAHAVRFYRLAFGIDPALPARHGHAAARSALAAGDDTRDLALTWLRAALDGLLIESITRPKEVAAALKRWKRDDALAAVDPAANEGLPDGWRQFWAEVDTLHAQCE